MVYRLAWLADVVLALERIGGFPGGCPGKEDLVAFVKSIKKPAPHRWDDLGRPAEMPATSPIEALANQLCGRPRDIPAARP
jgi:hypothetical protein